MYCHISRLTPSQTLFNWRNKSSKYTRLPPASILVLSSVGVKPRLEIKLRLNFCQSFLGYKATKALKLPTAPFNLPDNFKSAIFVKKNSDRSANTAISFPKVVGTAN